MSDPAWRWGADADQPVDLVAFNGYPDLPDAPVNPPRQHRILAAVVAAIAGCAAMLVTALLVPATPDDLVAFVLLVGPFMGAALLTLGAWDRWVSHRRPALGSGVPADRIDRLANAITSPALFVTTMAVAQSVRPWSGVTWHLRAAAVAGSVIVLGALTAWLLMLGLGRSIARRAGARVAEVVLGALLAFTLVVLVAGLLQYG